MKLSTAHSLHSSCHSLEVWEKLPLSVTRGLPPCSPPNMTSPTAPLLPGSDVLSLFPSYDHPSDVLEVLDLLLATRRGSQFLLLTLLLLRQVFPAICKPSYVMHEQFSFIYCILIFSFVLNGFICSVQYSPHPCICYLSFQKKKQKKTTTFKRRRCTTIIFTVKLSRQRNQCTVQLFTAT